MLIHTLALLRKTLLAYCTIFQLSYLPIKKHLLPLPKIRIEMIENISFEARGNNQCEIKLQHSTGETTALLFCSTFPLQAQKFYLRAIQALLDIKKDLSTNNDLFSIFSSWFAQNSLEMPLGVGTSKNEERIRIGNRIKKIREKKHIDAKTLAHITGIDAANLCRIEQGKQSVGIDILSKIANSMGYKIDFVELNKT